MLSIKTSNVATPNNWLKIDSSRLMVKTPNQLLKIRTPSYLEPHTPNAWSGCLSVSRSVSDFLTPGGPCRKISTSCRTPAPVYQIPCRSYFQGECINAHCVDSHDPSTVAKCRVFLSKGECPHGEKCEYRHDKPGAPDKRTRFDTEKYRSKNLEKNNQLQRKITEEQKKNRELNRETYGRKVYTNHCDLGPDRLKLDFDEAVVKVSTLKKSYSSEVDASNAVPEEDNGVKISINVIESSPGGPVNNLPQGQHRERRVDSLDVDFDGYFDELLDWISDCDVSHWTAVQIHSFFSMACYDQPIGSPNGLDIYNTLFAICQPDHSLWALVISLFKLGDKEFISLMQDWMMFDDITELHIGGLLAGLLQLKDKHWNLDRVSNVLIQTITCHPNSIDLCSDFSKVLSDGCFLLGIAQYTDTETASKLIKSYLRSKEKKITDECECITFDCTCPSIIDWYLYGVLVFQPIFDYSGWDLSKKTELFSASTSDLWMEAELQAILSELFDEDDGEAKAEVLKACKSKEMDEKIMKHFRFSQLDDLHQEMANVSLKSMDDEVLVDVHELGNTAHLTVCQNIRDDWESDSQQCTNVGAVSCINEMCDECCTDINSGKCTAHHSSEPPAITVSNLTPKFIQLNNWIYTDEDEHWEFVTFGSIQPAIIFDDFKEFDSYTSECVTKPQKVEFSSGVGLQDSHLMKLADICGEELKVLEILDNDNGDVCSISDHGILYLVKKCFNLLKLKMVSCTKLTNVAAINIFTKCTQLQSVEISGAAHLSGCLKDPCLQPLFTKSLPHLCLLVLLDQYFIRTTTVERLRRLLGDKVKVIVGEREKEPGKCSAASGNMVMNAYRSPFTGPF